MTATLEMLDTIPNLRYEERKILKEIYREIKVGSAISIEDLPDKVGRPFKSTDEYKGVEKLVEILSSYEVIDMDSEITLYLNPNNKQTSFDRINEVNQFISSLFDEFKKENGNIEEKQEKHRDKKALNTFLSKQLGRTTVINDLNSFF
ncbi:MAG: hypothetical protein LBD75_03345 [Candidatus Peribacteria bacterium]|jgi:hypothetical protein|nr:hypothetical protein [Candidatus Peribacteria bacterium]